LTACKRFCYDYVKLGSKKDLVRLLNTYQDIFFHDNPYKSQIVNKQFGFFLCLQQNNKNRQKIEKNKQNINFILQ